MFLFSKDTFKWSKILQKKNFTIQHLLINTITNKKCFPDQHIVMISEESCNTEYWSNANESAVPLQKQNTF